jgi:hypothetical protein
MKGINPLLYGLTSFYQTSNLFQNSIQDSDSTTSLIGSTKTGMIISSQAKGISELYKFLKGNKNKNTLAGFNETIKTLVNDPSGKTNLNNFISFGENAIAKGKITTLANMLAGVKKLSTQGNSALGQSIVKQAGKTYADKGISLAVAFTDTATNIQNRTYSNSSEMTSTLKNFVDTWNSIRAQGVIKSKAVPTPAAFAEKIKSLDNDALKTYLSKVSNDLKK